ncbi:MAG: hypothetical protein LBQ31_02960, partial [Bacteroidales bacterium]|nr:hypothetical protein [Bacteroidales bacterium]
EEKLSLLPDDDFIPSLHHRSWIIQIPHLKQHRRNVLEQLLSVFDQENITSNDHILNIREEDVPADCRPIVRRLQQAAESPKMQDDLEMEDIYIEEFRSKERETLKALEEKEKALEEKEKALEVKDKTIEEQGKVIEDKDKALEEQSKALEEQSKTLEEQNKTLEAKEKEIEELKRRLNKE